MNNWIVVTSIALIFQMTAIYSASVDQYCAPKGATDSTVIFHNNCAAPVSVYMVAGNYGVTQGTPTCLKNLPAKFTRCSESGLNQQSFCAREGIPFLKFKSERSK
jgi:hypothetical protein